MPVISAFFGITIRMYYDEHGPPHLHAEYQGNRIVMDFAGSIVLGELHSRAAVRLIREWIDLHVGELEENWELARSGRKVKPIDPLS